MLCSREAHLRPRDRASQKKSDIKIVPRGGGIRAIRVRWGGGASRRGGGEACTARPAAALRADADARARASAGDGLGEGGAP